MWGEDAEEGKVAVVFCVCRVFCVFCVLCVSRVLCVLCVLRVVCFGGFGKDFALFHVLQNQKTVPFSGHGKAPSASLFYIRLSKWGAFAGVHPLPARRRGSADLDTAGTRRVAVGRTHGGPRARGSARG